VLSIVFLIGAAAAAFVHAEWVSVFFAGLSAVCVSGIANLYTGRISQTQSALCEILAEVKLWNDDARESIRKEPSGRCDRGSMVQQLRLPKRRRAQAHVGAPEGIDSGRCEQQRAR
jgi:hypothetical protein